MAMEQDKPADEQLVDETAEQVETQDDAAQVTETPEGEPAEPAE